MKHWALFPRRCQEGRCPFLRIITAQTGKKGHWLEHKARFLLFSHGAHKAPRGQTTLLHSPNLNLRRKLQNITTYKPSVGIYQDSHTCIGLLKLLISYHHPPCRHPLAPRLAYKIKPCKGTNPGMKKAKINTIPSATPNQRSE